MATLRGFICAAQTFVVLVGLGSACLGQSPANQPSTPQAVPTQAAVSPVPEADEDSADIPPFARSRISEEEYFALRDQEVRRRRGIDDLLRSPQARSQAVRRMEFQEQVLRLAPQGVNLFSGLVPFALVNSWIPLGPAPIPNGQTTGVEVAVSGRVTAIAVDPTSDQIVYVGTAQGGVYRSLDAGATWTPLLDSAQSLAIGAITIDPLNREIVFVGTGEGNLAGDSFFGVGIYIIRNASTVSPTISGPFNSNGTSDVFTGRAITKILVNPVDDNKILVSTASGISGLSADLFGTLPTRGVYLSTNVLGATPTFTRQIVQTGVAQNRTITDMVMDPGNASKVLVFVFGAAAAGDGGLWVSTTGDPWAGTATWTQTITRSGFGKFAVNRSGAGPTTTFLLAQDENATCAGIANQGSLKSSLDGVIWNTIAAASGFCGGQCFYDMVPAFHPTDVNTIYLGGSANGGGACSSDVLSRSTNGGATFGRIDTGLHADFHALAIAPSNPSVIYAGNDGGIFRSADGGTTWSSINTAGFNATQFMSFSLHPTDANFAIGGTQDNGTEFMKPDGTWTRADFGDGGYSAIDQSSTDTTNVTMYHTYFNQTTNLIAVAQVTTAAGATEGNWSIFGCPAQPGLTVNGINCADAVLFYAPIALGPGIPNTLYFGTDRLYRSANRGATMAAVSQGFACCDPNTGLNFPVSAIGISPQDDNVRIAGLTNGKVFATTLGANPMTDVTGTLPARFVARAVVDPNNKTTAYITLDGYGTLASPLAHVWKTTNLTGEPPTPTWNSVSSGLPDVPVNAFAVDPFNSAYLYAGTDIGVFSSINGGATWAAYGTGLPRVAVFDLGINKVSHKVRIGTHGRGAWEISASQFANTTTLGANTVTPNVGQNVIFTATVNKGTGLNVPTGTVTFQEGATVLGTGSVDGAGKAIFQTTSLAAGTHNITAAYGGDTLYLSSNSPVLVIDETPLGTTPTDTALATSSNSSVFGAAVDFTASVAHSTGVPAPTGTVTFNDQSGLLGSTTIDTLGGALLHISALTVGTHNVTANYGGDATYAASTSAPVNVVVKASTTLGLSPSSASPVLGANVTFTATLAITGTASVPTGQSVTFKDGATTLGTGSFSTAGVATFQTNALALGPHTITAQYAGDTTFAGSTSSSLAVTVVPVPPDYQVSIPNGSATVASGQSATYNISVTPQGGFTGTVSFACSGLPAASNCSFNPATVTPNGSAANTTLTIATTTRTVASARPAGVTLAAAVSFGLLGIVFLGGSARRKRKILGATGKTFLVLAIALVVASCGGGGQKPPPVVTGTPAGTFSVTISATSGATTHSSVITLVVQ